MNEPRFIWSVAAIGDAVGVWRFVVLDETKSTFVVDSRGDRIRKAKKKHGRELFHSEEEALIAADEIRQKLISQHKMAIEKLEKGLQDRPVWYVSTEDVPTPVRNNPLP